MISLRKVMKKMSCASLVTLTSLRHSLKSLYFFDLCEKSCVLFRRFSKGDPVKIVRTVGAHKIAKAKKPIRIMNKLGR